MTSTTHIYGAVNLSAWAFIKSTIIALDHQRRDIDLLFASLKSTLHFVTKYVDAP